MVRPLRATVFLAIAAEPAEKPDARLLALALLSLSRLISQRVSPEKSEKNRRGMRLTTSKVAGTRNIYRKSRCAIALNGRQLSRHVIPRAQSFAPNVTG